jgi:hypothetical protein
LLSLACPGLGILDVDFNRSWIYHLLAHETCSGFLSTFQDEVAQPVVLCFEGKNRQFDQSTSIPLRVMPLTDKLARSTANQTC